jgi:hypothetical protein
MVTDADVEWARRTFLGGTSRATALSKSGFPRTANCCGFIDPFRQIGKLSRILRSSAGLAGMKHFIDYIVRRCNDTHILSQVRRAR